MNFAWHTLLVWSDLMWLTAAILGPVTPTWPPRGPVLARFGAMVAFLPCEEDGSMPYLDRDPLLHAIAIDRVLRRAGFQSWLSGSEAGGPRSGFRVDVRHPNAICLTCVNEGESDVEVRGQHLEYAAALYLAGYWIAFVEADGSPYLQVFRRRD